MTPQGILLADVNQTDWQTKIIERLFSLLRTASYHEEHFIRFELELLDRGKTALPRGYGSLFEHLAKFSKNEDLVRRLAIRLHVEMQFYLEGFYDFGGCDKHNRVRIVPGTRSGADFLERLERNISNPKLWEKACRDAFMPRLAYRALTKAAEEVGKPSEWIHSQLIPNIAEVAPLLRRAREIASEWRNAKPDRDRILIEILRAYRILTGKEPTPKPAKRFIWGIDKCYRDLFARFNPKLKTASDKSIFGGALDSKTTFAKLAKQSLAN